MAATRIPTLQSTGIPAKNPINIRANPTTIIRCSLRGFVVPGVYPVTVRSNSLPYNEALNEEGFLAELRTNPSFGS